MYQNSCLYFTTWKLKVGEETPSQFPSVRENMTCSEKIRPTNDEWNEAYRTGDNPADQCAYQLGMAEVYQRLMAAVELPPLNANEPTLIV